MTSHGIYKQFVSMFPELLVDIRVWSPHGRDTIKLRKNSGDEFIFTYKDSNNWRLETLRSFENGKKVK